MAAKTKKVNATKKTAVTKPTINKAVPKSPPKVAAVTKPKASPVAKKVALKSVSKVAPIPKVAPSAKQVGPKVEPKTTRKPKAAKAAPEVAPAAKATPTAKKVIEKKATFKKAAEAAAKPEFDQDTIKYHAYLLAEADGFSDTSESYWNQALEKFKK